MNAVNAEFIDYAGFEPDGGTDRTERIAVAPAAERTQRITRVRQAAARVPEGSILRVLFVMLLTATAFVLASRRRGCACCRAKGRISSASITRPSATRARKPSAAV